jgi:hypothetical protein
MPLRAHAVLVLLLTVYALCMFMCAQVAVLSPTALLQPLRHNGSCTAWHVSMTRSHR